MLLSNFNQYQTSTVFNGQTKNNKKYKYSLINYFVRTDRVEKKRRYVTNGNREQSVSPLQQLVNGISSRPSDFLAKLTRCFLTLTGGGHLNAARAPA